MERDLNLKAKIAQFEAPNGKVNGTPARTTPTQKPTPNPSRLMTTEKTKTTDKTDFQTYPRNVINQSCDRRFEKPWNKEQRPKPATKPLELAKTLPRSADIVSPDKSENWIGHREEILLSPTAKNPKHIQTLTKIISAQGESSKSESSKPKSSSYSTVVPHFPSSQTKQKTPNSGNNSHSPVDERSLSGFSPSNPKTISKADQSEHIKAHVFVPKPPKTDVFRNASAGDRTLHNVAALSLSNQPQSSEEVPLNKTERSSPESQSSTPKIPGLQTSRSIQQKSTQQTSPKIKAAEDKATEHRNPVSKLKYQQALHPAADVTRTVGLSRRSNDQVTDVQGRRYRKLPLPDDNISAKPPKKPPKIPFAIDLEKFRPHDNKNLVEETIPGTLPRVVSMIPEWSVEEEEGENDQEDYEVCINNFPIKDGYVNEEQFKKTGSLARLKTNTGDENLVDEEIYESI